MSETPTTSGLPAQPNCPLQCVTAECVTTLPHCQRIEHSDYYRDMAQLGACAELGKCIIMLYAQDEL